MRFQPLSNEEVTVGEVPRYSAESPHFQKNGCGLVIYTAPQPCFEDPGNKYATKTV